MTSKRLFSHSLSYSTVPSKKQVHRHRNKSRTRRVSSTSKRLLFWQKWGIDVLRGSQRGSGHRLHYVVHSTLLFIEHWVGEKKKKRWRWLPVDDTISSLKTTIWDISCQPACSQHNSSSRLRWSTHRFWLPVHHSYRRMSLAGPRIIISLKKCVSIPCQLASVLSVIAFTLTKPINLQNCHTSLYLYPKLMSDAVNGLLLLSRY